MRRSSNNLIKSLFVLILALGVAGASTYAWIAGNNSAKIDGFNLEIKGDTNLLISLSGESGTFKSSISKAEIEEYLIAKYGENFKLTPATSSDGKAFADLDGSTENISYASITLYFQSNAKQDVFLNTSPSSNHVSSQRKDGSDSNVVCAWKDIETVYGQSSIIPKGDKVYASAMNAARISFVNGEDAVVWNPNPEKGFSGDYNYKSLPDFTCYSLSTDYLNEVFGYNLSVPSYYQTLCSKDYYDMEAGNYIITDKLLTLEYNEADEYYRGEFTVNIWLEGWDGDCFDSIIDDILTIGLQFQSVLVAE